MVCFVYCPAKIAHFQASHDQNYVLRLNISVKNLIRVHIVDGLEEVLDDEGNGFLIEVFVLGDELEKLAITPEFHQGVKVSLIMKKAVQ